MMAAMNLLRLHSRIPGGRALSRTRLVSDAMPPQGDGAAAARNLRELANWYRGFAERAGNPAIWDARLRTAEDLDAEASRIEQRVASLVAADYPIFLDGLSGDGRIITAQSEAHVLSNRDLRRRRTGSKS